MAIKFLKITPEESITLLEDCMNRGYQVLDQIRADYAQHTAEAEQRRSHWKELWSAWVAHTLEKLEDIYTSPSRAYNFREGKTTRYALTSDLPYTWYENDIEVKVQILKGYYDFIMRQSHPTITVNGDLNFQVGENINYEKK